MRVLVLGSGGRECAIIASLKKSNEVDGIVALPGNGGIAKMAKCVGGSVTDKERVLAVAKEEQVGFCVVTPDDPLAIGMVDLLEREGIPCFGPDAKAARIEASKSFAKDLMARHHIPTASYRTFTDYHEALSYLEDIPYPTVVKADGLALGKGVIIANDKNEATKALKGMMEENRYGQSGKRVVIEEFLQGPEVSVLAFTDGKTLKPMVSSMDHKRAYDGDKGPNTGGMGAIAPNPFYTKEMEERCMREIFLPTITAMRKEGCTFTGCLYFGLMLTEDGPKVIEYNSRFGDPEAEVVLPLLESDLLAIMRATHDGTLSSTPVRFSSSSACCVVVASGGYPLHYEKGKTITVKPADEVSLFIAGAKEENGKLVTSGGRVADVVAIAPTLKQAIGKAYAHMDTIAFDGMYYRHDIGKKALGD